MPDSIRRLLILSHCFQYWTRSLITRNMMGMKMATSMQSFSFVLAMDRRIHRIFTIFGLMPWSIRWAQDRDLTMECESQDGTLLLRRFLCTTPFTRRVFQGHAN